MTFSDDLKKSEILDISIDLNFSPPVDGLKQQPRQVEMLS